MCIRDSNETKSAGKYQVSFIANGLSSGIYFYRLETEGFNPVSYTHLRAHETVLDLVCRLLLEKKNKKKYTHENTLVM